MLSAILNDARRLIRLAAMSALGVGVANEGLAQTAEVCAAVNQPDERLNCYDRLFRVSTDNRVALSDGAWNLKIEKSKLDDSKKVFLSLDSIDRQRARFGKPVKYNFYITCRENKNDVFIIFGGNFMSDLHHSRVDYRVDERAAKHRSFRESNDHEALGLWGGGSSIPFIKELFGGTKLYVRATPMSESSVEAEFPIAGLEEAIAPLRESCNW